MAILKSDNATHSETQAKLVAFAFMIVVIVLYVTLVAMQYHRVDKYMFRMTALDTRYAFMLPLLMVITFLFLVSSKVFVWAIVPSGLVDAYGLLTFFSIMVEYCGGAQHVISFVNREGKPLTSIPFLHFSVFVEDARLYYSRTITALKYLCFLRPVLLFLHGFAFLYGGYVGKTVGILICSVSFVILTLAFVRVLTIFNCVKGRMRPLNGLPKLIIVSLCGLAVAVANFLVLLGVRIGMYDLYSQECRMTQVRLAFLILLLILSLSIPFFLVHARGIKTSVQPNSTAGPAMERSTMTNPSKYMSSSTKDMQDDEDDDEESANQHRKERQQRQIQKQKHQHPDAVMNFTEDEDDLGDTITPPVIYKKAPSFVPPLRLPDTGCSSSAPNIKVVFVPHTPYDPDNISPHYLHPTVPYAHYRSGVLWFLWEIFALGDILRHLQQLLPLRMPLQQPLRYPLTQSSLLEQQRQHMAAALKLHQHQQDFQQRQQRQQVVQQLQRMQQMQRQATVVPDV